MHPALHIFDMPLLFLCTTLNMKFDSLQQFIFPPSFCNPYHYAHLYLISSEHANGEPADEVRGPFRTIQNGGAQVWQNQRLKWHRHSQFGLQFWVSLAPKARMCADRHTQYEWWASAHPDLAMSDDLVIQCSRSDMKCHMLSGWSMQTARSMLTNDGSHQSPIITMISCGSTNLCPAD